MKGKNNLLLLLVIETGNAMHICIHHEL